MANINDGMRRKSMNVITLDNKLSLNFKKNFKPSKNMAAEKRKKYKSKQTTIVTSVEELDEQTTLDQRQKTIKEDNGEIDFDLLLLDNQSSQLGP